VFGRVSADVVPRSQEHLLCQQCAAEEDRYGPPVASYPLEALVTIECIAVACRHALTDEALPVAGDKAAPRRHHGERTRSLSEDLTKG
jgi:hypothetical protein